MLEAAFTLLLASATEQPRRFVQRDLHSRNLLVVDSNNPDIIARGLLSPGIIDFPGALLGPIACDLASLLRDCCIAWCTERVDAWTEGYRRRLQTAQRISADVDCERVHRWFDLSGRQRRSKVSGIFCRLHYRDGTRGYLIDRRASAPM